MPIFLLDTDMLSHYQRNHPQVIAAVDGHATDQLCVSTITQLIFDVRLLA
jgi:hypothetical protein